MGLGACLIERWRWSQATGASFSRKWAASSLTCFGGHEIDRVERACQKGAWNSGKWIIARGAEESLVIYHLTFLSCHFVDEGLRFGLGLD